MEKGMCEKQLYTKTPDNSNPGIVLLEHSLLDIGGSSIVQGLFYMISVLVDDILFVRWIFGFNIYVFFLNIKFHRNNISKPNLIIFILFRYFETGSYKGFLPTAIQYLKKHYSIHESNILPWQVYTPKDISLKLAKSVKTATGTNFFICKHCQ